jgi:hypothetical protein
VLPEAVDCGTDLVGFFQGGFGEFITILIKFPVSVVTGDTDPSDRSDR